MRKLFLNGWNLLLVVILLGGLLVSLSAALASVPSFAVPGLVPVGLVIVIEVLVTQRIVVASRLSWGDQGRLRGLEWALILAIVRIWVLLTDGRGVIEQVTPWLRDPVAFFTQRYMVHVALVFIIWVIATGLGHQVLLWSAEIARIPQLSRHTIERSHVDAEQAEAVRRFDSQLIGLVTLALLLAVFALRGESTQFQLLQPNIARVGGGAFAAALVALLLHSAAHLRQITDSWSLDGAQVEAGVIQNWQRMGLLVMAVALIVGPLLAPLALLVPPLPLIPLINILLVTGTLLGTLLLFVVALLLTPFVWLLSLLHGKSDFKPPTITPFVPPQIPVAPAAGERPLAPGLIFWSCLLVLLAIALLRYLQQHADILRWLRRWRVGRWLLQSWSRLWRDVGEWVALVTDTVRRRLRHNPATPHRPPRPRSPQGHLRALYQELVRAGEAKGIAHPPSATPFEYSSALGSAVPPVEPDVTALTDLYVQAEYGPLLPDDEDLRRGRQRWRRIQHWLGGTGQVVGAAVQKGRLRVRQKPKS
ncbi:MAG: DUF4129 domain-containing protein [Herpetosiphonaceae bacterium]|nr:DUF4129 domain-containing protein [Herpetosiphonaceae bacterium]